jgi:hypothetical protein
MGVARREPVYAGFELELAGAERYPERRHLPNWPESDAYFLIAR